METKVPATVSPDLRSYLRQWHQWTLDGAPQGAPFDRHHGLCEQTRNHAVYAELHEIFTAKHFYNAFPFGGHEVYAEHYRAATQHLCQRRLSWVRAVLATSVVTA